KRLRNRFRNPNSKAGSVSRANQNECPQGIALWDRCGRLSVLTGLRSSIPRAESYPLWCGGRLRFRRADRRAWLTLVQQALQVEQIRAVARHQHQADVARQLFDVA